jgi:WD40 repeat protein
VRELSWNSTSRYLATGGGAVPCVWDCSGAGPAGTTPIQLEAHTEKLSALAFQHAGPILASAGEDGLLALWQPGRQLGALALARFDAPISQIAWSADDRHLAAGTEEGMVAMFAVT